MYVVLAQEGAGIQVASKDTASLRGWSHLDQNLGWLKTQCHQRGDGEQ
jgi:hypothetical protein